MRWVVLCLLLVGRLPAAADTLEIFGYRWTVPHAADWKVDSEDGTVVLKLVTGREPLPGPRRPMQFAVAETPAYSQVTVDADVKPFARSLMIVFAYRDATHFDYAHLSSDAGTTQTHHNGIFHVYGGERVRISSEAGPASFPEQNRWYRVHLTFDGASGQVAVAVDGKAVPALQAVDRSLTSGRVGIGSFDETGGFRNVSIAGH